MKKILIVDDEPAIRSVIRIILQEEDRTFFEASNGVEAQAILEAESVDLIVSDIIMPDCDGIELLMAIREKYTDLNIVMISGGGKVDADHYLTLATKLGADCVFEKPFDTLRLRGAVANLLGDSAPVESTDADLLKLFQETRALLSGHFELRSGLHSNQFFQCAHILENPRVAAQLCKAMVEKMTAELKDLQIDTVIAPAMGGITIGHEVARSLGVRFIFVEKEDGALKLRRFKIKEGERFVIAEDVVTRGGRVQETIDIVEENGGIVSAIGILVNRSGGKASFNSPLISLLDVDPVVWEPSDCPLCRDGEPLVHPGS